MRYQGYLNLENAITTLAHLSMSCSKMLTGMPAEVITNIIHNAYGRSAFYLSMTCKHLYSFRQAIPVEKFIRKEFHEFIADLNRKMVSGFYNVVTENDNEVIYSPHPDGSFYVMDVNFMVDQCLHPKVPYSASHVQFPNS